MSETKTNNSKIISYIRHLGFPNFWAQSSVVLSGGIALIWKDGMNLKLVDKQRNQIEALVTVCPQNTQWLLTCLYGSPRYKEKKILWENISTRSKSMQIPWMIIGDLNITISYQEKISTASTPQSSLNKCIRVRLQQTDLFDVKFSGYPYTWNNHRQSSQLVLAKLDRALAHTKWRDTFNSTTIYSLTPFGSDHTPILLHTNPSERDNKKPFRLYENWLQQDSCKDLISRIWNQPQNGSAA